MARGDDAKNPSTAEYNIAAICLLILLSPLPMRLLQRTLFDGQHTSYVAPGGRIRTSFLPAGVGSSLPLPCKCATMAKFPGCPRSVVDGNVFRRWPIARS